MIFTSNLELKKLKEEAIALTEEVEKLDEKIRPVERKFNWEVGEIEFWISSLQTEMKSICDCIEEEKNILSAKTEFWEGWKS